MTRKILALILVGIILVSCAGCGIISDVKEIYEEYEQDQKTVYVAFSKDGEDGDPMDYQEIADYESKYAKYNSRVMYDTLSREDQLIYRFFEYALDHEYTSVFIDSRLLESTELPMEDILLLYSMDSAMVQQNYSWASQETSYTFSYLEDTLSFDVTGTDFEVSHFSGEELTKKKEALARAEEIYEKMPSGLSQLEQARYFFSHLIREVDYNATDAAPEEQSNLYDAFINEKTQCDGFSNAFSLLCGMAGIPCVEKIFTPEQEGEIGHTWDVFCADGVWYNADLALDESFADAHEETGVDFNFGFSDDRVEHTSDFAEKLPVCTTDLLTVDLTVASPEESGFLRSLKKTFSEVDRDYVLLCLEEGELDTDDLQEIANYINSDIHSYPETWGGKNHYYIFKD